ncbi:MAG: hypothetical protein OSA48_10385 [Akkermansiaceae bacterium]|nr:hypothetical protein [Akkermansiaceae bacterium]
MPALSQQLAQHPCADPSSPVGARLLLKEGRPYQEAVDNFSPYEKIQEPQPAVRAAVAELIRSRQTGPQKRPTHVYVNNRLEGNALGAIAAILEL